MNASSSVPNTQRSTRPTSRSRSSARCSGSLHPRGETWSEGYDRVFYLPFAMQPAGGVWSSDSVERLLRDVEASEWREEPAGGQAGQASSPAEGLAAGASTWRSGRGSRGAWRGGAGRGAGPGSWQQPRWSTTASHPANTGQVPDREILDGLPREMERRV